DQFPMTNDERMTNAHCRMTQPSHRASRCAATIRHSSLAILWSFVIGHSSFLGGLALSGGDRVSVGGDDFLDGTGLADLAVIHPDAALAECRQRLQIVADQDNEFRFFHHIVHALPRLVLK